MKSKLTTLAIVLLACMNVLTFIYSSQTTGQLSDFKKSVDDKTNKIIVYKGENGYTPVKGLDYFDGKNGISAVSYSITSTVVKEVPIMGPQGTPGIDGKDGVDAPFQELRINPETGDLESKMSDIKWWGTLIPCSELKVNCPGQ